LTSSSSRDDRGFGPARDTKRAGWTGRETSPISWKLSRCGACLSELFFFFFFFFFFLLLLLLLPSSSSSSFSYFFNFYFSFWHLITD
jgi:hypothetical protein